MGNDFAFIGSLDYDAASKFNAFLDERFGVEIGTVTAALYLRRRLEDLIPAIRACAKVDVEQARAFLAECIVRGLVEP